MKQRTVLMTLMGVLTAATFSSCSNSSDRSITTSSNIQIGGSSEGYPVLEILAAAYENEDVEITFAPSSQTSGGIAGVKDEAIDIGIVSRQLTATENTDNIQYLAIAIVPMVLVTNESVEEVTNLNAEQIRAIYSAEITNWRELGGPDAEIILLDLPEDENEKQVLREHYLGEDLKITPTAIIFSEDDEILEVAAANPSSIGPIALSKEVEKMSVNVLNLDGVEPTVANVKAGKYKLTQTIGIVFLPQTTGPIQDFINFTQSEEAKDKLERAGYVVLSASELE